MGPHWVEIFWLTFVFCVGASVGSFLNVVVARLPFEKSLIWPGSRCGSCNQPIRGIANLPVLSYLLLRGRCRVCGTRYSSRYMWVELFTGLAFAGVFYLDVLMNWHQLPFVTAGQGQLALGWVPWPLWALYAQHVTLLSFLLAAALCDFDGKIIPLSITVTGTMVGLAFSTIFPWPWPSVQPLPDQPYWFMLETFGKIPRGITNWPVWGPLPDELAPGGMLLGFVNGLAGAAAGNLMMRAVKFLFEQGLGTEALGLGDADLMMMAGAFLGWQMAVVGFFIGNFVALFIAIPTALRMGRRHHIPFGPGLAVGIMITMLNWRTIGPSVQAFFFDYVMLSIATVMMGGGMFVFSLLLRRGK